MSNILNSEDFGLKIYNRFPPKYREDDAMQEYALRRFLQALSDGGFKYSIDEINGITDLIDPDKVDAKVLPILFKQYGLEIFNGIPEQYLRYLLPKLGEAWSKKGSLSVVEFITSSLSGIKTTTDVLYDDDGNPTIDVILEMDYSLGDYFPEAEQFTRLLKNFVPFYSDVTMSYSYLFYESQVLVGKAETLLDNLSETQLDGGLLRLRKDVEIGDNSSAVFGESTLGEFLLGGINVESTGEEVDTHEDSIVEVVVEPAILSDSDEETSSVSLALIHDEPTLKVVEYSVDEQPKTVYSESASFRLKKENQSEETNALLGEAIMGLAVLGESTEYSDTHEDSIIETKSEVGTFNQLVDTLTNKEYNMLNGSFCTNGLYNYDIITIGEVTEIVY